MSAIQLTTGMRQNLYALQSTQTMLEKTQSRLSSGLKVQTALDDPINFFAAAGHRQRATDLAQRKDEMGEAIQTIKAANNGIEALQELIASAKSTAQSALAIDATATTTEQDYKDRSALSLQFMTLRSQIDELAQDSGYKGLNFLQSSTMTVEFAENAGDANLKVVGFDGDAAGLSVDSASGVWTTDALVTAAIADLDTARAELRTRAKELSNSLSTITTREEFTSKMINTLEDGASQLTEADMNEEGANMLMLQTRQSLGTTSLSLASQAAQSVLRLF